MGKLRFGKLLCWLLVGVSLTTADSQNSTCENSGILPTLEQIVKSSVQETLTGFFNEEFFDSLNRINGENQIILDTNDTDTAYLPAGCPIGWFRILNSCLWVPAKDSPNAKQTYNDAYMNCKRKIAGGKLFEPSTKIHSVYGKDLVNALDDEAYADFIWIGINDHVTEGKYVYTQSDEPIDFENWNDSQPENLTSQNCVGINGANGLWHDLGCSTKYRFICEKSLS